MNLIERIPIFDSGYEDYPSYDLRKSKFIIDYSGIVSNIFLKELQDRLTNKRNNGGHGTEIRPIEVDSKTVVFVSCAKQPQYRDNSLFMHNNLQNISYMIRVPTKNQWFALLVTFNITFGTTDNTGEYNQTVKKKSRKKRTVQNDKSNSATEVYRDRLILLPYKEEIQFSVSLQELMVSK